MKIIHGTIGDVIIVKSRTELEKVSNMLIKVHGYTRILSYPEFETFRHPHKVDTMVSVDEQAAG